MIYASDFETTTDVDDCRVWAWGMCEVGNPDNFIYGNTIDTFMEKCENKKTNDIHYIHNLKFDGMFIMYWLFRNNFKHILDKKDVVNKSFTTLISDKGQFYTIEIFFKIKGKRVNKVTFYDSLKLLNFSVEKIAKDFNLPCQKQELDYRAERKEGHELTGEEVKYLKADVEIMSRALHILFQQNMDKMTIGSNALAEYKKIVGRKKFEKTYPQPYYDSDVRMSYKGGWTFLQKKHYNKIVGEGIVLDVNSLYPWVMHTCKLPVGEGIYYEGKYKKDKLYNLYIQRFTCSFEIKKEHLPTIQMKNNLSFCPTEYLEDSRDSNGQMQEVQLCLTSIDLNLFLDHYNVYNINYIDGYKFMSSDKMFKNYIDKWIDVKIKATEEGNGANRTIAKLMLNSLYGKFALNPIVRSKIPVYNKDKDLISFVYGEWETRNPIYIPVGSFITSYAREKTIRSAQMVYDRFIYADTDSLHLIGTELPKELELHPTKLGAWDYEFKFDKAKFLRQKCYMEYGKAPEKDEEKYTKVTCAGMPKECHKFVTFDNFSIGAEFEGKLRPKNVSGGIVLCDTPFTIKNMKQ